MVIKYLDSKRISALAADTKPTNVEANSILVEKDTGERYWFDGTDWTGNIDLTGLKAYYNFNESSGNLINQSTTGDGLGSSADGTNTSVSYSQTGKIGNAYTYTRGTSKTVLGSSLSQFNFMHNQSQLFSINVWYKLSGSLVNVVGMMGDGQDNTAKIGLSIYAVATGALSINTTNGSSQDALITGGGIIPNNTNWHMLTVTYNRSLASSNWLTYIDGVLVATINKSGSFTPSNSNASHAMELGTYGTLAQSFFGTLDECSIWNRILTTDEISTLYNSGRGKIVY